MSRRQFACQGIAGADLDDRRHLAICRLSEFVAQCGNVGGAYGVTAEPLRDGDEIRRIDVDADLGDLAFRI